MEPTQTTPLLGSVSRRKMSSGDDKKRAESDISRSSIDSIDKYTSKADAKAVADDDLQDDEPPPFKLSDYIFRRNRTQTDPNAIATRRSVYDDQNLAPHYWPKADWENIHRFDPKARWTFKEEKDLLRKIDWRVMLWAAISFSALNLDRNNLTHANSDNFLPDLGMTTNDFNLGNSVFRLAFLCAELPSQLISKRLGPDRWIPLQMCLWSLITCGQFFLSGRTSFLATRALLGLCQGGFIPDLILYLSYFYTKTELPFRLALFWISSNICSIFGSFLSFGVLHMRGVAGKSGWRWLFLVEFVAFRYAESAPMLMTYRGIITLIIGIATFFKMPPGPTQTRTWFRPNGWFNEREETIAVTRVLRDDPTKGDMHNREGLSIKRIWTAVCDYDLWPLYIAGLLFGIPISPPSTYLSLSLRNLGIPSSVTGMIAMFTITLISETVNQRALVAMIEDVWALPFLIAIYTLPDKPSQWKFYVSLLCATASGQM
ncbi:hypothetical protein H0H87_000601 [Tephrocybe sp. NHM501043]|nr:hypothetical protein H0H87_000601 [Tephrocybe sp. NHM501043]